VPPADQVEVVFLEEHFDNVFAEGVADPAVGVHPAISHLVRVTPEQVADESGVGHVGGTHDVADLLERVQFGGESAVHAEDLLVNDGRDGQVVEQVGEEFPQLDVVSAFALVLEALDTVDARTLVVATQQEEVFGVLALLGHEDGDGLERLLPAVHVVAKEELVGVRWERALLEETQQVELLPMRVPRNVDGRLNLDEDRLFSEDVLALGNQPLDFILQQVHVLAWLAGFHFQ